MLKQGFLGVALCGALAATSAIAAPVVPKSTSAVVASPLAEQVYYYRGGYYPYHWNGRYYHHRRWRGGRWSYW